jgi:hypothetical protein
VTFSGRDEVEVRGLVAALGERLDRRKRDAAHLAPAQPQASLIRRITRNIWFVGLATGVLSGLIVLAIR